MFHTCFLSPTAQKCVESSTYWQFFYYRPSGKFQWFTHLGEIVKMSHTHTYMTLLIIDMDFLYQIDCTTFHSFLSWNIWKENCFLKFSKVGRSVNVWLVGEVDNYVAIYGSRVAEGYSAFQCRSCWVMFFNCYIKLISPSCCIYASVNWISIGSGNDLSPVQGQANTWNNDDL